MGLLLVALAMSQQPSPIQLFDGKSLAGWHMDVPARDDDDSLRKPFVVRDGVLVTLGTPRGHLITDKPYGDYKLIVEYRFPGEPGNCGVLVHCSKPRRLYGMFPQSMEVQLQSGHAGDFWCIGEDIRVPDMVERRGPEEKWGVEPPMNRRIENLTDGSENPLGEWNTMVVRCQGDKVTVWVNGDLVNDGTGCTATKGQIALQAEGAEVEFRRLTLKKLGSARA